MALQSHASITSSYRTEPAVTTRQPGPTYTTAGTIYNPNTSQPLQPPARRGRSVKWNPGLPPDLALLPKSLLSALPLQFHGSIRPAPAIQYSPLQQNYDRAVSPTIEPIKPALNGMIAQTPRTFVKDSSVENGQAQKYDLESSDDEHEETELRMKPLLNMPVKSLHNLASYPNPNQKIAQKMILRGVRSNLASNMTSGADAGGRNSTGTQEDFAVIEREPSPFAVPSAQTPSNIGSSAEMARRKDLQFVNHGQMRASLHRSNTEGSMQDEAFGSTTLASGPGAPRPLTAGPPGQRQYRPSTFDMTFKALRAKDMKFGTRDEASPPHIDQEIVPVSMPETGGTSRSHMTALLGDSIPFDPKDDFASDGTSWVDAWQRGQNLSHYKDRTFRTNGVVENQVFGPFTGQNHTFGQSDPRSYDDAPPSAEERAADRLLKVTSAWESGQFSRLGHDRRVGDRSSTPGVIGDKGVAKGGLENGHGDELSIEEANMQSAAEHAQPLLELVLASLDRNLSWSHFSTPDQSLIDDSPEGNKSLFGKPPVGDRNRG